MNTIDIKKTDKNKIASTYARHDMAASSGKGARCYDTDGKEYIDMFYDKIGIERDEYKSDYYKILIDLLK